MKQEEIKVNIDINDEPIKKLKKSIDETIESAEELAEALPQMIFKNNKNVYITINHFKEDSGIKEEVKWIDQ